MILSSEYLGEPSKRVKFVKEVCHADYTCGCHYDVPANQKRSWPDWISKSGQDQVVTAECDEVIQLECPHKIGYLKQITSVASYKTVKK